MRADVERNGIDGSHGEEPHGRVYSRGRSARFGRQGHLLHRRVRQDEEPAQRPSRGDGAAVDINRKSGRCVHAVRPRVRNCRRESQGRALQPRAHDWQNLNMEEALLSRFDLIFILLDTPNTDKDDMLADHIMGVAAAASWKCYRTTRSFWLSPKRPPDRQQAHVNMEPLSKRLARDPAQNVQPLRPSMLRKYLAYAKMYCRPTLSKAACRALQKLYLELRQNGASEDTTPLRRVNSNRLCALRRRAAKLELRSLVTAQDAADIISLMRECVMDDLAEDDGLLGFQDFFCDGRSPRH